MLKVTFPRVLLPGLFAFLAIVGAGCGPSDADIEEAVREHYEAGTSLDGLTGTRTTVNTVKVLKRGDGYTHHLTGTTMYPVRVYVKGTTITGLWRKEQSTFERQEELQITWQEPDRSRVDPGPGRWVVWQLVKF